jgi:hypothetical protein
MFSVADLPHEWRDEAAKLRRRGLEDQALFMESLASELEDEIRTEGDELLTIAQAAAESGYGKDSLRKLVRDGTIPNAGEPYSPHIRRRNLPRKPGRSGDGESIQNVVDYRRYTKSDGGKRTTEYNPEEDARSIAKKLGRQ